MTRSPTAPTAMDIVNDIDARVDVIKTLAELSELLDGNPEYCRHAIVLLGVIACEIRAVERSMTALTVRIRDCLDEENEPCPPR